MAKKGSASCREFAALIRDGRWADSSETEMKLELATS